MTNLRPFFCFYGGKWRAAPRYPTPEYGTIVEPFAGAAGYSTRYADRRVTLVERDPVIANLWRYLTRVSSQEIRRIPDVTSTVDDLNICQEAKWLVGFWCNKGTTAPAKRPSSWMRSNIRPASYWGAEVREIIASQVESIRHWQVIEGSYESAPTREATWFIDPPYEKAGTHYRFGAKQIDYGALATWCKSRVGQVIVCENAGATWLPFEVFATIKANPSKSGGKSSDEVIWRQK